MLHFESHFTATSLYSACSPTHQTINQGCGSINVCTRKTESPQSLPKKTQGADKIRSGAHACRQCPSGVTCATYCASPAQQNFNSTTDGIYKCPYPRLWGAWKTENGAADLHNAGITAASDRGSDEPISGQRELWRRKWLWHWQSHHQKRWLWL